MKKVLRDNIIPGIVLLIIGGAITFYVTSNKERKDNKTRFLDYSFDINNKLLSVPEKEVSKDIKIFYRDSLINNLTSVDILLFNFSDRDYENVTVNVELRSSRSKDTLNIIQSNSEDMNKLPGQVVFVGEVPTFENKKILQYNIKTVNRSSSQTVNKATNNNSSRNLESSVPVVKLSYLMTGSMLLQVKVSVDKKGLLLRKYDFENYEQLWISRTKFYILMSAISFLYLLFLTEVIKVISGHFRKNAIAKKLFEEKRIISETLSKEYPELNNLPDIVEKIYEVQKKEEEAKGGWLKKLFGIRIFTG